MSLKSVLEKFFVPQTGKNQVERTAYRDGQVRIPDHATRYELRKVLKHLEGANRDFLPSFESGREDHVRALRDLVADNIVRVDAVNNALEKIVSSVSASADKAITRITDDQARDFLLNWEARFTGSMNLHRNVEWSSIKERLERRPEKLSTVWHMANLDGQPDVVDYDKPRDKYIIYDCSWETPDARRGFVYDREAEQYVKDQVSSITGESVLYNLLYIANSWHTLTLPDCKGNAVDTATNIGATVLTADEHSYLMSLGQGLFNKYSTDFVQVPEKTRNSGRVLIAGTAGYVSQNTDQVYHYHHTLTGFRCKVEI